MSNAIYLVRLIGHSIKNINQQYLPSCTYDILGETRLYTKRNMEREIDSPLPPLPFPGTAFSSPAVITHPPFPPAYCTSGSRGKSIYYSYLRGHYLHLCLPPLLYTGRNGARFLFLYYCFLLSLCMCG